MKLTKAGPERCIYCGRFIAWDNLGRTARKLNDTYLAPWAHNECLAKSVQKAIEHIKTNQEKKEHDGLY